MKAVNIRMKERGPEKENAGPFCSAIFLAGRGRLLFCFKLPRFSPFLPQGGAFPEKGRQEKEYSGQKAADKDKDQYQGQRTPGGKGKKCDRYDRGILDGKDHKEDGHYQSQSKKKLHKGSFQMD
ncbi:MAG: hypothetical protein M0Z58_07810 [Nitrospiraceae bacterium]|nr:hypothetical protein [Nitrospiraceae bacterium]